MNGEDDRSASHYVMQLTVAPNGRPFKPAHKLLLWRIAYHMDETQQDPVTVSKTDLDQILGYVRSKTIKLLKECVEADLIKFDLNQQNPDSLRVSFTHYELTQE